MIRIAFILMLVTVALSCKASSLHSDKNIQWSVVAIQDIGYFHRQIMENHPGVVNPLDPDFIKSEKAAYDTALSRANQINSVAGYYWMMRGYTASFNNGHVAASLSAHSPHLPASWPDFLTNDDNTGKQVVTVTGSHSAVPLGAVLVSCDGMDAQTWAARNIAPFVGAWQLKAVRQQNGFNLFLNRGNPFIDYPQSCIFNVDGKARSVAIVWHPLPVKDVSKIIDSATDSLPEKAGLTRFSKNSWWLSMPTFNPNDNNINIAIGKLKSNISTILKSSRLVIDLRGNDGGDSDYARQIASIIWGTMAVDRLPQAPAEDWRATEKNLAWLIQIQKWLKNNKGQSDEVKREVDSVVSGMNFAIKNKNDFFHQVNRAQPHDVWKIVIKNIKLPVYVLTDEACFSACLDAVDYFRALGAIQIGRETNGDSFYMEGRMDTTPSGLSRIMIPMEVYRDRPRGSLETWKPDFIYNGNLSSTARVQDWILHLPTINK